MIMELIDSMDKYPNEAIIRILREYVSVVSHLSNSKDESNKKKG